MCVEMATGGAPEQPTLQRTRDTLGKIIKKPPLTDKLLSRPPFRFIHDIITEVRAVRWLLAACGGDMKIDVLLYR